MVRNHRSRLERVHFLLHRLWHIWTPYEQMPYVVHEKERQSMVRHLQHVRTRNTRQALQALSVVENEILQILRQLWTLASIQMPTIPVRSNFDPLFSKFFRSFLWSEITSSDKLINSKFFPVISMKRHEQT